MAADIFDYVFIFNGGRPFDQTGTVDDEIDLSTYRSKVKDQPFKRDLLAKAFGADDDVNGNAWTMLKTILEFCDHKTNFIGKMVLLGRSAGCTLALELAARLNNAGIRGIDFIGVSDVPMWDAGRSPEASKTGAFKPINGPGDGNGCNQTFSHIFMYPVPNHVVPFYELKQKIDARIKVNLYQIEGNHMKFASSLNRWIWCSDMSADEVHGELGNGFENRWRTVSAHLKRSSGLNIDASYHIDLNTGPHWKKMCSEAATELANL